MKQRARNWTYPIFLTQSVVATYTRFFHYLSSSPSPIVKVPHPSLRKTTIGSPCRRVAL
jgi:hypothetical protein